MYRILLPPSAIADDHITVRDPEQVHHLIRVLRVKSGEMLECFDGRGLACRGPITHINSAELTMAIAERLEEPAPRVALTLAQALIKPERFEWVVQKATELGVTRIIPLICARSTAHGAGASSQRLVRWRRIAEEATAQCGRSTLPVLETPMTIERLLEDPSADPGLLFTLAEQGPSLREQLPQLQHSTRLMLLIGPEGDFSPEEVADAARHGMRVTRLGQATLRSETAALAALAVIQHALGVL